MKTASMIAVFAPLVLAGLSANGFAGGSSDGGGNSIVCFDSDRVAREVRTTRVISDQNLQHITSMEVLDLHEALSQRTPDGAPRDLLPFFSGERPSDYLKRVLDRVKPISLRLFEMLDAASQEMSNKILIDSFPIRNVNDSQTVTLPETGRCALITTAINYRKGDSWYVHIDGRMFFHPKHSELSRAVLLLHEYVYSIARQRNGDSDSTNTRALVRLLIIRETGMTVEQFLHTAHDLRFLSKYIWLEYTPYMSLTRALYRLYEAARLEVAKLDEEVRPLERMAGDFLESRVLHEEKLRCYQEKTFFGRTRTQCEFELKDVSCLDFHGWGVRYLGLEKCANLFVKLLRGDFPVRSREKVLKGTESIIFLPRALSAQEMEQAQDFRRQLMQLRARQLTSVTGALALAAEREKGFLRSLLLSDMQLKTAEKAIDDFVGRNLDHLRRERGLPDASWPFNPDQGFDGKRENYPSFELTRRLDE